MTSCRSYISSGPLPIPWTSLDQFAERHALTEDIILYETFMEYMSAMDAEYLMVCSEAIEKGTK